MLVHVQYRSNYVRNYYYYYFEKEKKKEEKQRGRGKGSEKAEYGRKKGEMVVENIPKIQ